MHLASSTVLVLISLVGLSNAAPHPLNSAQMGSKHNLYLSTCTRRAGIGDCPLPIFCSAADAAITYTAIAYFPNGPISTSGAPTPPSQIATVSEPPAPWEGASRGAKLGRTSSVNATIDAGAATLAKGDLAGSAKLDQEDFICFKDGTTSFEFKNEWGIREYSCTADYWCPSIQV
ncbi:hypothetical protein K504DRAFT_447801 [Pleomassaria siparia CBS 279.74]|uniref:Uncharacterized protein n=1 Tax=Pleomassaria siparia CBS 279.74 TaxID=1314801 RepID=A0A6G1K2U5_9PLEO|nr:hypothetical protein K504DRAFT_447801 [Pleomassaria siparia CBS 279.74]